MGYSTDLTDDIRLRLRLALADYYRSRHALAAEIAGQLAQLDARGSDGSH